MRLVTDKLGSYRVAHRDVMPLVTHDTTRYANNRAEVSHQPTRQRAPSPRWGEGWGEGVARPTSIPEPEAGDKP